MGTEPCKSGGVKMCGDSTEDDKNVEKKQEGTGVLSLLKTDKKVEKDADKKVEKKEDKKADKKQEGTGVLSLLKSHEKKLEKAEETEAKHIDAEVQVLKQELGEEASVENAERA